MLPISWYFLLSAPGYHLISFCSVAIDYFVFSPHLRGAKRLVKVKRSKAFSTCPIENVIPQSSSTHRLSAAVIPGRFLN